MQKRYFPVIMALEPEMLGGDRFRTHKKSMLDAQYLSQAKLPVMKTT
jgi:hypothetical protein